MTCRTAFFVLAVSGKVPGNDEPNRSKEDNQALCVSADY